MRVHCIMCFCFFQTASSGCMKDIHCIIGLQFSIEQKTKQNKNKLCTMTLADSQVFSEDKEKHVGYSVFTFTG